MTKYFVEGKEFHKFTESVNYARLYIHRNLFTQMEESP